MVTIYIKIDEEKLLYYYYRITRFTKFGSLIKSLYEVQCHLAALAKF